MKTATKLKRELPTGIEMGTVPLMKLSPLAEDIHVARGPLQNTHLDM